MTALGPSIGDRSLVPRLSRKEPGTHCVRMSLITLELYGVRILSRHVRLLMTSRPWQRPGGVGQVHVRQVYADQQCYSIHFSVEKEGTLVTEREGTQ